MPAFPTFHRWYQVAIQPSFRFRVARIALPVVLGLTQVTVLGMLAVALAGLGHGTLFFFLLLVSPFLWYPIAAVGVVVWPIVWLVVLIRPVAAIRRWIALFLLLHYAGLACAALQPDWFGVAAQNLERALDLPLPLAMISVVYLAVHTFLWMRLRPIFSRGSGHEDRGAA